jgi:RNA polymerase sigma-70 factor (ECF subfamily)
MPAGNLPLLAKSIAARQFEADGIIYFIWDLSAGIILRWFFGYGVRMGEAKQIPALNDRDATLVDGLIAGDAEAGAELFDLYGARLLAFASAHFPHDRPLAEDIMILSLAGAARSIRRFNPRKATLLTWLYGIARQQVQGELRKRRRLKAVPPTMLTPGGEEAQSANFRDLSGEVAERVDAHRLVAQLASELSALEFDILVLNCVDGLSAREIGKAVGRSERAVHSILHRARVKARERLGNDES